MSWSFSVVGKLPQGKGAALRVVHTSQFYSELMAHARISGKAISTADGYIAATAAANGLAIATRDTSPFEAAGLK
jgi:predicted nucleic acid-binding protein